MEFESIGLLRHLKETLSAVQEKQISSYKRNASKIDEETVPTIQHQTRLSYILYHMGSLQ